MGRSERIYDRNSSWEFITGTHEENFYFSLKMILPKISFLNWSSFKKILSTVYPNTNQKVSINTLRKKYRKQGGKGGKMEGKKKEKTVLICIEHASDYPHEK